MTVGQLARVYEEIVGEPARSRHKQYLIRRILWRVQARAEGDLSERARRRAAELADDADVRVTPPRRPIVSAAVALPTAVADSADALADRRLPLAGNLLVRKYKPKSGWHRLLLHYFPPPPPNRCPRSRDQGDARMNRIRERTCCIARRRLTKSRSASGACSIRLKSPRRPSSSPPDRSSKPTMPRNSRR
jgi:hypothetical protein